MLKDSVVGKLREVVGSEHVLTEGKAFEGYCADGTAGAASGGLPEARGGAPCARCAVVLPADAGETGQVVGLAAEEGLWVVARGGGTGLWGGAVPSRDGIVVSTERMSAGPEIHSDDLYAAVGAGVPTVGVGPRPPRPRRCR